MNNDELMSRRRFFKKAAKGLLPMLGAFVAAPTILTSLTSCGGCDGCEAACMDDCEGTCSGSCSGGCNNNCLSTSAISSTDDTIISEATGSLNGYGYIDLGLSVKWATYDIGASSIGNIGTIFQNNPNDEDIPLDLIDEHDGSVCGTEYDIAYKKWGKNWRMPTRDEVKELILNCSITIVTYNGKSGFKLLSKNGRSIFFPRRNYDLPDYSLGLTNQYHGYTGDIEKTIHWSKFFGWGLYDGDNSDPSFYASTWPANIRAVTDNGGYSTCGNSCTNSCKDTCSRTCAWTSRASSCDSCSSSCSYSCTGSCSNTCTGGCTSCTGSCHETCADSCYINCTETCESGCKATCTKSCANDCTTQCTTTCADTCKAQTSQYCSNCASNCSSGCTTTCADACKAETSQGCSNCATQCSGDCQQECTYGCGRQCYTSCGGQCKGKCGGSCQVECTSYAKNTPCSSCGGTCRSACNENCTYDCYSTCKSIGYK